MLEMGEGRYQIWAKLCEFSEVPNHSCFDRADLSEPLHDQSDDE